MISVKIWMEWKGEKNKSTADRKRDPRGHVRERDVGGALKLAEPKKMTAPTPNRRMNAAMIFCPICVAAHILPSGPPRIS